MNDNLHIADTDLTLYAMGVLTEPETEQAAAHLAGCAVCREELRQITLALAAYAQCTPEAAMPAGARERFMERVAHTPQVKSATLHATAPAVGAAVQPAASRVVAAAPRQARPSQPRSSWFGGWSLAMAGAFAVLLVVVGIDDLRQRAQIGPLLSEVQHGAIKTSQFNQLMELLASPSAKRVALHPGPVSAPPPEGRVVYSAKAGKLLLTASNLRPLPEGKVYQLWILQPGGKQPLPSSTFEPDGSGNASIILADAPADLTVQGFGVTIEKAGGSATPTLPIVLSGF